MRLCTKSDVWLSINTTFYVDLLQNSPKTDIDIYLTYDALIW